MKRVHKFQYETIQGFKFGSHPFGQPKMFSHVYFIDGLLIDTGHPNMKKEITQTLSTLPVNQIYLTHHHEDHCGNLAELQNLFKCPTYASSACQMIMKNPPDISFAQWMIWGKAAPNEAIKIKETKIDTPKYSFEIISTPGHAIDMVCLYEPNQGWLFSADLWVSNYIKYFMRSESMKQQIDSIKNGLKI